VCHYFKTLFVPFTITWRQEKSYKLYELDKIALLTSYDVKQEPQEIKGYISEKNKWRLEEFYRELS